MKCYSCERTRHGSRYRLGRTGLCEFDSFDDCQQERRRRAWKANNPGKPLRDMTFFTFLLLLLS